VLGDFFSLFIKATIKDKGVIIMVYRYAKTRSDKEKKEIYDKWHKLINMSQKALDDWAENDHRLLASINREKAKDEGGIQSGYDSFHRIKRRKEKKFEDWTAQDFDNATQENGFNGRMLGGTPGEPVGDSGMSKWEISLRNWGHDPSLKSSPQHSKWKAWKKKHTKKKGNVMRNRKASIHNVLVAHQQNMMIRRAILATGNVKEFDQMRRVYSMIISNSKTAYAGAMNDAMDQLNDPQVKEQVGLTYFSEIINNFKEKLGGIHKGEITLILNVLKSKGLVNKLHTLVDAGTKPKTEYERLIADRLQKAGNFSATLKMMGQLLAARTPHQVSQVAGVGINDMRDMFGIDSKDVSLANWGLTKWDDLNKYITKGIPDHKLIVVKLGLSILKVSVVALLLKTSLAVVGAGIIKVLGVILLVCLLTDTKATAQIVRKLGVSVAALAPAVLKDLTKSFKFLKNLGSSLWEGGKSMFKKLFRRAAIRQIQQMLRENINFRRAYLAQLGQ
jgi:hypothetical protein